MNESDLIRKILNGISPVKCTGDVYISDSQNVSKQAVDLYYDGVGNVIITFNGRFK